MAYYTKINKSELEKYLKNYSFVDVYNFKGIEEGIENTNYFFTHGEKDQRIYVSHFDLIKNYTKARGFNAEYWLVPNAGHVDSMLMYTEEYGGRMKIFFEKNLGN